MLRYLRPACLLLFVACGHQPAPPVPVREMPAVQALMAGLEGARLASPDDNGSPLLKQMREQDPGYDPYTLRHDLTGDGRTDLVVVLRQGDTWPVYWFRGTGQGYAPAAALGNHPLLEEGGLVVKDRQLGIGRFYSDVASWYRWNPRTRSLELQDDTLP